MLVVTVLAWIVYRPGLASPFIFDDLANLPALGASGPIDNAAALLRYLTSGHADPIGRPLASATFLLDARDWPADAFPFKRTNVLLHALNALLLFATLLGFGRALGWQDRRRHLSALIAASAWLLHPFFVSTVLYVVQREAMLPATFTLLALLAYLRGRRLASEGKAWRAIAGAAASIGACTLLATLSKANGLLIPLLVLIAQEVLPRDAEPGPLAFRRRCRMVLGPLAFAVPAYLAWVGLSSLGDGPLPFRGWSVTQRMLTEPSIMWHYVAQLWLVTMTSSSLLHDDLSVASTLFSPWYTLPAIFGWLAVVLAAWRFRHRAPTFALAVLFFAAGHLMESTTLSLELYFDHRNYLPAMLLFWPLGDLVARLRSRTVAYVSFVAIAGVLASLTYANTQLWADPLAQGESWAATHPASPRAQAYAAQLEAAAGRIDRATVIIERAARRFPGEPQIALNQIDIHCLGGALGPTDVDYARSALTRVQREPGPLLANWMASAITRYYPDKCAGLTRAAYEEILDGAASNARITAIPGRRQDVLHLRGVLALTWSHPDEALPLFDSALAASPTPGTALAQAAALGAAGYPELGLRHLDFFDHLPARADHSWREGMPWLHDIVLERQAYWAKERKHLQQALMAATAADRPPQLRVRDVIWNNQRRGGPAPSPTSTPMYGTTKTIPETNER